MTQERIEGVRGLGAFSLIVSRIKPRIQVDPETGQAHYDIDLDHPKAKEALDELATILSHPRYKGFMEGVLNGHKTAFYSVIFGAISIIVATGMVLGPRHGRDIHRLFNILEEHRKNK